MIKHVKKHHWDLAKATFIAVAVFVTVVILWQDSIISAPSRVVYYLRSLNASLAIKPNSQALSRLEVRFHKQEHSLSCEAAVVKMVLDYYGLNISESEIIKNMPFDATKRSGNIWGDPDKGFVGNIDGKMGTTGYGIHWDPVAKLVAKWKRAEVITNGLAPDLTFHISEGRPVIAWGYSKINKPMSWQTPEGKTIYAINGEHARVVYGFKGDPANPDGFMVMDPIYGSQYWTKSQFMRNWDAFGRSGVVVYP